MRFSYKIIIKINVLNKKIKFKLLIIVKIKLFKILNNFIITIINNLNFIFLLKTLTIDDKILIF